MTRRPAFSLLLGSLLFQSSLAGHLRLSEPVIRQSRVVAYLRTGTGALQAGINESLHFESGFVVPGNSPSFLVLATTTDRGAAVLEMETRLTVHFAPKKVPLDLEEKAPPHDWANPGRRFDFRAVVSVRTGRRQNVVDLNRDVFEAVSKEKLPYDLSGREITRTEVVLNRPAEEDREIRLIDARVIALTGTSMKTVLLEELEELESRLRDLEGDRAAWLAWHPRVSQAGSETRALEESTLNPKVWRAGLEKLRGLRLNSEKWTNLQPKKSYRIGTVHSLTRVSGRHPLFTFRNNAPQINHLADSATDLQSAANEYESLQLVLMPISAELRNIRFQVSDLKSKPGSVKISARNVRLYHQIEQRIQPSPGTSTEWAGWLPDVLLPVSGPFNVSMENTCPIWITVYTPPDTPPGKYEGEIRITASNAPAETVPIRLAVHDFAIPKVGRFRTQGHFSLEGLQDWYGKDYSSQIRRDFSALLLQHRLTPTSQYSARLSPDREDIPWILRDGGNVLLIGGFDGRDLDESIIQPAYDWLVESGYVDKAIIYIGDETDDFAGLQRKARIIRDKWPRLRIMVGGSKPREELVGYVDVWDPITSGGDVYNFDPESTRAALRRGEEVFWYTCVGPRMPFANVYNDHPLTAIRALWWQAWQFGVTGFEYWWFNWWQPNLELSRGERPWPETRTREWNSRSFEWANGDGLLVYPGRGGQPLASIRLSVMRDAIEDWETLFLLQRAAELAQQSNTSFEVRAMARKLLDVPEEVTAGLTRWSREPHVYLRVRSTVYQTLSSLVASLTRERFEEYTAQWVDRHQKWLQERFEERVGK